MLIPPSVPREIHTTLQTPSGSSPFLWGSHRKNRKITLLGAEGSCVFYCFPRTCRSLNQSSSSQDRILATPYSPAWSSSPHSLEAPPSSTPSPSSAPLRGRGAERGAVGWEQSWGGSPRNPTSRSSPYQTLPTRTGQFSSPGCDCPKLLLDCPAKPSCPEQPSTHGCRAFRSRPALPLGWQEHGTPRAFQVTQGQTSKRRTRAGAHPSAHGAGEAWEQQLSGRAQRICFHSSFPSTTGAPGPVAHGDRRVPVLGKKPKSASCPVTLGADPANRLRPQQSSNETPRSPFASHTRNFPAEDRLSSSQLKGLLPSSQDANTPAPYFS